MTCNQAILPLQSSQPRLPNMQSNFSCLMPLLSVCLCFLISSCGKQAQTAEGGVQSPEAAQLTQQVRRYSLEKRKLPQTLDDLVVAGYIKTVPQAPIGKKYAVDAERAEVILVDQ
jgi:competence protein ComGC